MKRTILFFSILLVACSIHAQDIFKKHGYNKETLTLSKGRYKETFVNENVMQIGTVLIDTRTDKVVQFLEKETAEIVYKAENTSRFLTPDPLAEKYPWLSPYVYCSNNPINRIDPSGMDDYSVNQNGYIVLLKKTEDETDRVIALGKNDKLEYDDNGNMTNSSYTVNKGILDNQKKSGKINYMSVKDNEQAAGLFEFLSENTTVEWGRVSYEKSSNYISTMNSSLQNGIETLTYDKLFTQGKGDQIKSIDHSHPNLDWVSANPTGFNEHMKVIGGNGDKSFAVWLYTNYPKNAARIQLRVYRTNGQGYIRFDNKKIYDE